MYLYIYIHLYTQMHTQVYIYLYTQMYIYLHIHLFKKSWICTAPIPIYRVIPCIPQSIFVCSFFYNEDINTFTQYYNTSKRVSKLLHPYHHNKPVKKSSRFICNILCHPTNPSWLRMCMLRVYSPKLCLLELVVSCIFFCFLFPLVWLWYLFEI